MRLTIYTDATERGGAEISLGHLLAALDERIRVDVLGIAPDVLYWLASRRPATEVAIVPPVRSKRDVGALLAHRRILARTRPDVFHANLRTLAACQYALVAALTVPRVPLVAVEHSLLPPTTRAGRALKRWTSGRLAAHVAVGERAAREVERLVGLPGGSVRVIHNGVPPLPPLPGTPDGERELGPVRIGWLGRMDRVKGLDGLLAAMRDVPGAHLVLVGEGEERPALERLTGSLGLGDRVHFRPWTDDPSAALERFDLFVLSSLTEALPLGVLEAMMSALPVVATDVGSVREAVVDGETGLVVAAGDVAALAAALRTLVADPARRGAMGARGRARAVERFTATRMASDFESLYDEIRHREVARARERFPRGHTDD